MLRMRHCAGFASRPAGRAHGRKVIPVIHSRRSPPRADRSRTATAPTSTTAIKNIAPGAGGQEAGRASDRRGLRAKPLFPRGFAVSWGFLPSDPQKNPKNRVYDGLSASDLVRARDSGAAQASREPTSSPDSHTGLQKERRVQVLVRDNNVDRALKALKKKMQREGIFREMKLRGHYENPRKRRHVRRRRRCAAPASWPASARSAKA